jgi:cell division protein DivIC
MKWKKVLKIIFNKYLVVLAATGVWLTFFDRNDVFTQLDLYHKVQKLKSERDYYRTDIEANKKMIKDLQTNPEVLEKFAREHHLMKKPEEEVFVLSKK